MYTLNGLQYLIQYLNKLLSHSAVKRMVQKCPLVGEGGRGDILQVSLLLD